MHLGVINQKRTQESVGRQEAVPGRLTLWFPLVVGLDGVSEGFRTQLSAGR